MTTVDGYQYFPKSGLVSGLPTKACVSPSARNNKSNKLYDAIIVGAGYTGLIACRELALRGHDVLLIEARDRIGGRTFSADFDGQSWDIGGTWMHWTMPYVYNEITRYGLVEKLQKSNVVNDANAYLTLRFEDGSLVNLSPEEETRTRAKALTTFFDVDGEQGHLVMPNPHRHEFNREAFHRLSRLSVKERMKQVQSQLTDVENTYLAATMIKWVGMDLTKASFFDCMRWWSLAGYHPDGIKRCAYSYKLECGQTGLAREIFKDVCSFPNVSYTFQNPISKISRGNGVVKVDTVGHERYSAKQLICTIPWNVLDTISFEPALPTSWQNCIDSVNINMGNSTKVYAEVKGQEWDAWSYLAPPGNPQRSLDFVAGLGITPKGNSRLVCFSHRDEVNLELFPQEDPEQTMASLKKINPKLDIQRLVWHDWSNDQYAKGVWVVFRTAEAEKRLPVLRESVGPIHFANADWAHGWRGYIDGAIEQGLDAAGKVRKSLLEAGTTSTGIDSHSGEIFRAVI